MRRALTLAMVAAAVSGSAGVASAQMGGMGQASMAPAAGVVNRAVSGFQNLNQNGPGWLYYGINAADRGLGYNGSYMTLGGFIPYAEDDLGGFWAADLRGHLSEYGGFFSNVGFVRKQFVGGTLLGVGVYWDYDGDQNQYPTGSALGTSQFGQFGHSYHQVGISGEWLTDFGNIRSNGYIPVGSTAYTAGNPGSPFYQNYVMCQYGLDAALSGTDLEVGAYIPGLADWAGMISVGGYALGNARYNWNQGSLAGKDVVPWFGGVYTRLDMTFLNNWDFSLQANNDSYFDWTGFARLTYRMGGSRRRNVPDQMEQPMMRNEHIVRAHQTPIVSGNPFNGGQAWRVIHVNNAAAPGGDGTAAAPFQTVAQANAAATNPWDIVFVDPGNGLAYDSAVGGNTTFTPLAANQYFIGNGAPFYIPTDTCGLKNIATLSGVRPLLTNPTGPSIEVTNGLVVNNFNIVGSQIGILGTGNLSSGIDRPGLAPYGSAVGASVVNNVAINGTQGPNQTGVRLKDTTGDVVFQSTKITDMTAGGFVVDSGDPNVVFNGQITSNTATNGGSVSPIIDIKNTTGGEINLAVGNAPAGSAFPNAISDTGGQGIQITNNTGGTINIGNATLTDTVSTAINVMNSDAKINVTDSSIVKNTAGTAINVDGGSPEFAYKGTITNQQGNILLVNNTQGGSVTLTSPTGTPFIENGDGILVENTLGNVGVIGATINSDKNGVFVTNSSGSNTFTGITIQSAGAGYAGVNLQDNTGSNTFENLRITTSGATGFLAVSSNTVDVIGSSTVTATNAMAVSMKDVADANINFITVASADSPTNGILLDNVTGLFRVSGGVTVTNPAADGFVVKDSPNLVVDVAQTTVTGAQQDGIVLTNNSTKPADIKLGTVTVTTTAGTGLQATNSGVTTTGGTITAQGGAAIALNQAVADITLASGSSTGSTGNGLDIVQTDGKVVIAKTSVASPTGNGINAVDNVPGFTASFGQTTINGIQNGAAGVNITNTVDPAPDTVYSFDSLAIQTTKGTGLKAVNGGTININSNATTITAAGGAAIDLENTTGTTNNVADSGFTFGSLTSIDSGMEGVRLVNLNSDLQVLGETTISNAAGTSILIQDTEVIPTAYDMRFGAIEIGSRKSTAVDISGIAGQAIFTSLVIDNTASAGGNAVEVTNTSSRGTGGRVYINAGSIDGSKTNGIFAEDSILAVTNITITNSGVNAILAQAGAGQTTTTGVSNSTLQTALNDGVRLQAGGGGIVNGTIIGNSIDVALYPISAIAQDSSGTVLLNASNNSGAVSPPAPGAGNILLDNSAGGTVGVSQANVPAVGSQNNGAGVTTAGTISVGQTVPPPPPP